MSREEWLKCQLAPSAAFPSARARMIPHCKACGRPDKFDFYVPDEVWRAALPPHLHNRVVCLYCFDEFACQAGVEYGPTVHALYFAGEAATLIFKTEKALAGSNGERGA